MIYRGDALLIQVLVAPHRHIFAAFFFVLEAFHL
jgi:hypothetical protein